MNKLKQYSDTGSLVVMGITLVLFILALFTKGMTHDILLEAGVFLVSVKIIMMAYKINIATSSIEKKIDEISKSLKDRK